VPTTVGFLLGVVTICAFPFSVLTEYKFHGSCVDTAKM
jgi:hypothetical protein